MIAKVVDLIVHNQVNSKAIKEEDISVYRYGYTLMFELAINILIGFLIGIVSGQLLTVILFSAFFIPLRSFAGGWHASKAWICTICSNGLFVVVIYVLRQKWYQPAFWQVLVAEVILALLIFILSPVESPNKKLNEAEKKHYKKVVGVILLLEVLLVILFGVTGYAVGRNLMLLVHVVMVVALVVEKIKAMIF